MAKQKDFDTFLKNIEPSQHTVSYISSVQNNLRDYLESHTEYGEVHVQTFLSGSYAKNTSIRPKLNDGKRDVDIVAETIYDSSNSSIEMLEELRDVLLERTTYGTAKLQSHSVGIELEGIDIDVVPVIRSEDGEMFCIGASDKDEWSLTNPKGHISWSSKVNADNNQKYKPLVKMLKWWRRTNCPDDVKYPKGLTLEKIVADNLPSSELCTEDYLWEAMKNMVDAYKAYSNAGVNPTISDPCLYDNDLLAGYEPSDFSAFILKLSEHLELLADSGATNDTWRLILGSEFPKGDKEQNDLSRNTSNDNDGREQFIEDMFPVQITHNLRIDCKVTQNGFQPFSLLQSLATRTPLRHNKQLDFFIDNIRSFDSLQPYSIYWKVRNVGEEAQRRNCIRGQIKRTNKTHQNEHTDFYGPHFVECYIVKDGVCVARKRIDVPIGTY